MAVTDEKKSWLKTVSLSIAVGFLSGVGVMSMTLHADVREHGVLISVQHREFEEEKIRTDKRIATMADVMKESNQLVRAAIDQSTKLINTIDVQNRLILDQQRLLLSKPPP